VKSKESKLNREEQELEASIARGEWRSAGVAMKRELVRAAKSGFERRRKEAKGARVNIRISEADVRLIQKIADERGLPYQTLMSSILHQFATGSLVESDALERVLERLERKRA
jgi:hypothetical protein